MDNEYLDILTEDGNATGESCLKSIAHKEGLFHATVHIWFYTKNGHVLLQQRGSNKETFPSYWDVSVAGHVLANESVVDAAIREVEEEINLNVCASKLTKLDVRKNINLHPNGIKDCEFQNVFVSELQVDIEQLQKQDSEVDDLCLLSLTELEYYANHKNEDFKLVPADYSYYHFIVERVRKIIS